MAYTNYYVNKDDTGNPHYNHEVHTDEHAQKLGIVNKALLGYYDNCADAVKKAKELGYTKVDGCANCCSPCHKE